MKNQGFRYGEQGSVIIWIFVLIVLLAALTFAATRGSRTGLNNMDKEKVELAAAEILGFSQSLRDGARSLKVKGCDESAISFAHPRFGSAYDNPGAPADGVCHIYRPTGASLTYLDPQPPWLDISSQSRTHYGQWFITGDMHVLGVGTAGNTGAGCPGGGSLCKELVAGLPYISLNLCQALNRKLHFGGADGAPPRDNGGSFAASGATPFTGSFSTAGDEMGTATPANYPGRLAGCIEGGGDPPAATYHFYQVLLAR